MSLVYIASIFSRYFSFTGPIPESIAQLQSLTELLLSRNQLEGAWDITSDDTSYLRLLFRSDS